jgi:hypothetical protein
MLFVLLLLMILAAACGPAATPTAAPSETPTEAEVEAFPTPTPEVLDNAAVGPDLTPPTLGDFDPATVADIDIEAYPVMPEVTDHAREIFAAGRAAGLNPRRFSKIGDCMTAAEWFLTPFGTGEHDLGEYTSLQPVLDFFGGIPARDEGFTADSFANPGLSTASGFNAASVLDPAWADPEWCQPNESPLACEYRVTRPGIAIVMFGTNDVFFLEAHEFDFHYRNVILATLEANILPVLNTFPVRPEFPEQSLLFNQIIIRIAEDYDLPLVNLYLALQALPDQGVDTTETIHLTVPADGNAGILDEEHLTAGYTFRNLITLQALDVLRQELGLMAG